MQPQSTIYLLEDRRDGLIRYIGLTRGALIVRVAQHITHAARGNEAPVSAWLRDLIAADILPRPYVIDRVPLRLGRSAETYWIWYYGDRDAPLLNVRPGLSPPTAYLRWLDQRCQDDHDWLDHIDHIDQRL